MTEPWFASVILGPKVVDLILLWTEDQPFGVNTPSSVFPLSRIYGKGDWRTYRRGLYSVRILWNFRWNQGHFAVGLLVWRYRHFVHWVDLEQEGRGERGENSCRHHCLVFMEPPSLGPHNTPLSFDCAYRRLPLFTDSCFHLCLAY